MSIDAVVAVTRKDQQNAGGRITTIASGISMQIDNMSIEIAKYLIGQGESPNDLFDGYIVWGSPDIHRLDTLLDYTNTDPVTKSPTKYDVVGNPEKFPDGHTELRLRRTWGT